MRHSLKKKIRNEHLRDENHWIVLERKWKYKAKIKQPQKTNPLALRIKF